MASANHLLMIFLAVEMTSVPSYAMVGFLKGRRTSSEAAPQIRRLRRGGRRRHALRNQPVGGTVGDGPSAVAGPGAGRLRPDHASFADPAVRTLAVAILMVLVGVAFKLSLFPFHFWCPDAFEGAAAEVGGYLSVASKGAAFALLVRFCLALIGEARLGISPLSELYLYVGLGLGIMAAVTATFGNLAAYTQTNMKRLLAYSTIAHAGYMLMAVSAMMVVLECPPGRYSAASRIASAETCIQGLLYYLTVYFFMNLGAFAIVAIVRNQTYSEEDRRVRGARPAVPRSGGVHADLPVQSDRHAPLRRVYRKIHGLLRGRRGRQIGSRHVVRPGRGPGQYGLQPVLLSAGPQADLSGSPHRRGAARGCLPGLRRRPLCAVWFRSPFSDWGFSSTGSAL